MNPIAVRRRLFRDCRFRAPQRKLSGKPTLKKIHRGLWQSWIYKNSVVAPYSHRGPHGNIVGIWKYPSGSLTKSVTDFGNFDRKTFGFTGATISLAGT